MIIHCHLNLAGLSVDPPVNNCCILTNQSDAGEDDVHWIRSCVLLFDLLSPLDSKSGILTDRSSTASVLDEWSAASSRFSRHTDGTRDAKLPDPAVGLDGKASNVCYQTIAILHHLQQ